MASSEWIVCKARTLLSHYFDPGLPAELEAEAMVDWVDDLHEFTEPEIADAMRQWRRSEPRKRPTPGSIREIIRAAQRVRRETLALSAPVVPIEPFGPDTHAAPLERRIEMCRQALAETPGNPFIERMLARLELHAAQARGRDEAG